jgi:hypothetical protein
MDPEHRNKQLLRITILFLKYICYQVDARLDVRMDGREKYFLER